MIKKNIFHSSLLLFFSLSLFAEGESPYAALAAQLKISAAQAVLLDFHSETILFERNAYEKMTPSSMTKIMTAYQIFEALEKGTIKLDTAFYISPNARAQTGSRMFLEQGSSVPVLELLKGTVVSSGNDSTVALAEGLAGSEAVFASQMTTRAQALGARNTQFLNSSGLPHEGHYSTAYDLALLGIATIKDFPDYYEQFYPLLKFEYNKIEQYNRNKLLRSTQNDYTVDGLKTGFTDAGGYGMVFSATKGATRLLGVVNGLTSDKDRMREARALLQWGFNQHNTINLMAKNHVYFSLPIEKAETDHAEIISPKNAFYSYRTSDSLDKLLTVRLETLKTSAPIEKGEHIANLYITGGLKENFIIPLHSKNEVKKRGVLASLYTQFINLFSPKTTKNEEDLNKAIKTSLLAPVKSTENITL